LFIENYYRRYRFNTYLKYLYGKFDFTRVITRRNKFYTTSDNLMCVCVCVCVYEILIIPNNI